MKLERLHEYVLTCVALIVGLGFAVYCGKMTGAGQFGTVALSFFVIIMAFAGLTFRSNVWVVIPLVWPLLGQVPILPIPAALRDVIILSIFGMFLAFKALKLVRIKPKVQAIDLFLLLNLVWITSEFLRNPVGSLAFGSSRVGGRPYFTIFTAALAYWVLSRAICSPKVAGWLPFATFAVRAGESALTLLCARYWALAAILGNFYSNFAVDTHITDAEIAGTPGDEAHDFRQVSLSAPGLNLAQALICYYRPLTLINPLYIFRFACFTLAMLLIFYSGFRSVFILILFTFLLSAYFRDGWSDTIRIGLIGSLSLGMLGIFHGTIFHLPLGTQRALSFFPGNWDTAAIEDAKGSTRWRVEMWKDAIFTDKYIESKWLGDGFGVSASQMQRVMALGALPFSSGELAQESAAIIGNFHSGPVTTVRFAGYIGFIFFYMLLIPTARVAVRILRRAMGSPYQALALFLCIPMVLRPFFFAFVFGGYAEDVPETIFCVGLLKMLGNSLDRWETQPQPTAKPNHSNVRKPVPVTYNRALEV